VAALNDSTPRADPGAGRVEGSPANPILQTRDLTRRFGRLVAVDRVNISVETGELFALLGANGAGKTVTLKMLTTLLPPSAGNATVAGFDIVHHARDVRRVIGYVPQLVSADGSLTGYENLRIFARLYDLPRRERDARVEDALAFMDLAGDADKLVRHYSGGMIRRLEIAQAMLHRPRVLFLDEPTVGLDPIGRHAVWERVEQLREEYGTTIVFTTHLMDEADAHCTRLAIMHRGAVVALGTPAELKAASGRDEATLDDVFVHYAGGEIETGGGYRETTRARRTAQRLG
jgi:ABC-2 type transport system ATP-binding protein